MATFERQAETFRNAMMMANNHASKVVVQSERRRKAVVNSSSCSCSYIGAMRQVITTIHRGPFVPWWTRRVQVAEKKRWKEGKKILKEGNKQDLKY